jgi:hypothetical protein
MMKKILFTMAVLISFTACEKDNIWGDGDPALEHVYYIGFHKDGAYGDKLTYTLNAATATADIPFEFHSERVRTYDVTTLFWIKATDVTAGTDFMLSLGGKELQPDANGAYSLTWPQAVKGIQNVTVTCKGTPNGKLLFYTLNPANGKPDPNQYETTTVNNHTEQYEVRGLSFDWETVTVTFQ